MLMKLVHVFIYTSTNTCLSDASMLARRLRRRLNIEPTLGQRLVFAGILFDIMMT